MSQVKIPKEVLSVLNKARIEDNTLYIDEQLERKLYLATNKILDILGGKWVRGKMGHVFNTEIEDLLLDAINTGEVTDQIKKFQFYKTPDHIIEQMIELADIKPNSVILEPSCGEGAILGFLPAEFATGPTRTYSIEIDPAKVKIVKERFSNTAVKCADFLDEKKLPKYDRVVMNPPFSRQQDIDHIFHALHNMETPGILVAIVSEGAFFRDNKKSIVFRQFLLDTDTYVKELPQDTFVSSGANVKSRIIKITA